MPSIIYNQGGEHPVREPYKYPRNHWLGQGNPRWEVSCLQSLLRSLVSTHDPELRYRSWIISWIICLCGLCTEINGLAPRIREQSPWVLYHTRCPSCHHDLREFCGLPSGGSPVEVYSGVRSTKSWSSEEFFDSMIYKQEMTDDFLVLHSLVILFNESSQSELAFLGFLSDCCPVSKVHDSGKATDFLWHNRSAPHVHRLIFLKFWMNQVQVSQKFGLIFVQKVFIVWKAYIHDFI